mmetsp:Transcript_53128/g.63986  ORF Transcript_53128/g.63986 Transcript_53128/m.63986 type:complete len:263 (+) Transcript_53128:2905-3693(+)
MPTIVRGRIPSLSSVAEEYGGGSIMIPRPFTHKTYPDVDPPASKPCEFPKMVTPKLGGWKEGGKTGVGIVAFASPSEPSPSLSLDLPCSNALLADSYAAASTFVSNPAIFMPSATRTWPEKRAFPTMLLLASMSWTMYSVPPGSLKISTRGIDRDLICSGVAVWGKTMATSLMFLASASIQVRLKLGFSSSPSLSTPKLVARLVALVTTGPECIPTSIPSSSSLSISNSSTSSLWSPSPSIFGGTPISSNIPFSLMCDWPTK